MSSASEKASRDEWPSAHFSGHLAWCMWPQVWCFFGVRLSFSFFSCSLLVRRNMWRKLERRLTSSATKRLARFDGREGETTIVDERALGGCEGCSGDGVFVRTCAGEGADVEGASTDGGVDRMEPDGREEECLCEDVPSPFSSASVGACEGDALGAADGGGDFVVVVKVEVGTMPEGAGVSVSFCRPFLVVDSLSTAVACGVIGISGT